MFEKMFGEFKERNQFDEVEEKNKEAVENLVALEALLKKIKADNNDPESQDSLNVQLDATLDILKRKIKNIDIRVETENKMNHLIGKAHDQAIKEDLSGIHDKNID